MLCQQVRNDITYAALSVCSVAEIWRRTILLRESSIEAVKSVERSATAALQKTFNARFFLKYASVLFFITIGF
ncbi:MAG: hypothetical protein BGO70_09665 [Bacteroidetes bacterium 43-93]|nr:MAG: hypothetical protein BGO70_09665 [Bacteroidetes bacterium 43-93]